jgi:hypothetical protein
MPGADAPTPARLWALEAAGGLAWWSADLPAAEGFYRTQLALAKELADEAGTANAVYNLAHTAFGSGDQEAFGRLQEEALRRYRELGDEIAAARSEWLLGYPLVIEGRLDDARDLMTRLLPRFEAAGDEMHASLAALTLSAVAALTGDLDDANRWAVRSIQANLAMDDRASLTLALRGATLYLLKAGRPVDAAVVDAAFEALCDRFGFRPPVLPETFLPLGLTTDDIRAATHEPSLGEARERGATMTLQEAIEYFIETVTLPSTTSSPRRTAPGLTSA